MEISYEYYSDWCDQAQEPEENRFLSLDDKDLQKICDRVDLKDKNRKKTSGGIPVHYDPEHEYLYVLKEGPHTRVCGESGSKKSRTICRGAVISAILNGDSFICVDPKGEISSDPKIQNLLKSCDVDVHALDFRKFDKDGFNCFSHIIDMVRKGNHQKAMASIDRFAEMLVKSKSSVDDFWNDTAGMLVKSVMNILRLALVYDKRKLEKGFNIASVKAYISQDRDTFCSMCREIMRDMPDDLPFNPVKDFADILGNPEKTYACIISSANALLRDFCSSEDLLRMLSVQTFNIKDFYKTPSALFLIIPDEESTYDVLVGYLLDTMYQLLIEEYTEQYQDCFGAPCNIKYICDEVASIKINQMSNKISASRSRQIDWTLIYQSEKQMQSAYSKDFGTICGNCKHHIFLGSSDYELLQCISDQTGTTNITPDGTAQPLVSVADLRRMKKEKGYKEALLMSGNYLYCAKLPDYDSYSFLVRGKPIRWINQVSAGKILVYSPEQLYDDWDCGKIRKLW